jgi:homopolymeric O-antigen transport system permease protein
MRRALRLLHSHRDLLLMITWRDIQIKYKQSIMGFLWAILMPSVIVLSGVVIRVAFSYFSAAPIRREEVLAIAVKSLPWAFFVASIRFSSVALIANQNLLTKIYFPRLVFPVAAIASQLFDFLIATVVLVVVLALLGVGVSASLLWVPLLVAMLVILALGLGIFLSAANLFFRDVKYVVEVILTFAIFFTPVLYEAEMLGARAHLLLLNPVAPILEGLRTCVILHRAPDPFWTAYSAGVAILLLVLSVGSFIRLEPLFAESI